MRETYLEICLAETATSRASSDENTLESAKAEIVMRLLGKLFRAEFEQRHNLARKLL